MSQDATILIVDDEPVGRDVLAALLHTYHLVFAHNGSEAIAQATTVLPDLILLDVMMPDLDGYEVCRQLRATPLLAEVPIVLVTALDDRHSRLEGIAAGADDFVSKPYDRAELRARVQTITRLNRYRRLVGQRAQFEWVVEQSDEGYVIVDSHAAIHYANAKARLYLGAHPEGQIDGTFSDLAGRQYRLEPSISWDEWFQLPVEQSSSSRFLIRPASDNADIFMLHGTFLKMAPDPDPRYLIRLRDVTTAISEQQSRWTFQALVRHKLRTSLTQLLGGLLLLDERDVTPIQGTPSELLAIMLQGAERLKQDINNIFEFMEAPAITRPERGRCTLSELVAMIDAITTTLERVTVCLEPAITHDQETAELAISQSALRLILDELCENARKFHPHQLPTIEISVTRDRNMIELHVCDDGQSLSPDQLAQVWRPYYQGERGFTGQVPGMGLGLPTVASLLWRVGGSCRISNRQALPGVDVEVRIPLIDRVQRCIMP